MGWGIVFIVFLVLWDVYNIYIAAKYFDKDDVRKNLTKGRNLSIIVIALLLTGVGIWYCTEDALVGIVAILVAIWAWIQALFS